MENGAFGCIGFKGPAYILTKHRQLKKLIIPEFFGALGSGGLAATGVLEMTYPKTGCGHCSLEEGIGVAIDAVRAGVENDLGSGSCIDVCIIAKEGLLYRRAVVKEEALEWVDSNHDNALDKRVLGGGVNGFGNVPIDVGCESLAENNG